MQPSCDAAGIVIARKFSFVASRIVRYQGEEALISWCSNVGCPDYLSRIDVQSLFQGADFPDRAADERLQGVERLCTCSQHILEMEASPSDGLARLKRQWSEAADAPQAKFLFLGATSAVSIIH